MKKHQVQQYFFIFPRTDSEYWHWLTLTLSLKQYANYNVMLVYYLQLCWLADGAACSTSNSINTVLCTLDAVYTILHTISVQYFTIHSQSPKQLYTNALASLKNALIGCAAYLREILPNRFEITNNQPINTFLHYRLYN